MVFGGSKCISGTIFSDWSEDASVFSTKYCIFVAFNGVISIILELLLLVANANDTGNGEGIHCVVPYILVLFTSRSDISSGKALSHKTGLSVKNKNCLLLINGK